MQSIKNTPKKACLISLGCKVNKYEIDCMANMLKQAGYEITLEHEPADIYIVNTCAVTNEGEKKSRQYISKLSSLNPNAKIVVCGCASENNVEQFLKPNVVSIIGNEGKQHILELLENSRFKKYDFDVAYNHEVANPIKSKTRAYIKIQDGCNNFCSYCLIPYVRGRSRSRNFDDVIKEATELAKTHNELVITGIDLSSYKIDGVPSLGKVVYALKDLPCRVRIGSLEVNVITEEFMEWLAKTPNFCPQFHLSLQSGSNGVLKRMNRHYTTTEYLSKIELIKKYFPDANITTDVIVGFCGETEDEFEETCETCRKAQFGNIHIFPYSKRAGTRAYVWDCPDGKVAKDRVNRLVEIKKELANNYYSSMTNKTFKVLIEEKEDEYYVGYTENYIKVYINDVVQVDKIYDIMLLGPHKAGMLAKLINKGE
ncbi:MAG: tRNA (N(6)-L-threonylcarbamoyladenosine(37)-C(2))-methylthiotransferase MtaB [Clostridia bacterium]|nr:tRNA (N(6)-L-threonylcarbamoyladenosine(37)-C(2))-methylthiotransferase MtaB [Clostridia bacterium]